MFRATMCPSSGELTVSMRHWYFHSVWVAVWSATQSEKYQRRMGTVSSADGGHIVARNKPDSHQTE